MALDESKFHAIADDTLEMLVTTIDDVLGDRLDVDEQSGILTITLKDGGQFILNKHGPMRQLWLASPNSGAWHFDWAGDAWISTRGEPRSLLDILTEDLEKATGVRLEL